MLLRLCGVSAGGVARISCGEADNALLDTFTHSEQKKNKNMSNVLVRPAGLSMTGGRLEEVTVTEGCPQTESRVAQLDSI